MTGEEWLSSSDGVAMARTLWVVSPRKRRLFCVACARRALPIAADPRCEQTLNRVEAFADGIRRSKNVWSISDFAWQCCHEYESPNETSDPSRLARQLVAHTAAHDEDPNLIAQLAATVVTIANLETFKSENNRQAQLVRELMGN